MLANFYGDLLPREGNYSLWTKTDKQHHWSGSLDELTENTEDAIGNDVQGLYFATAAFDDQYRRQANVLGKKCFYLDLDAGAVKLAKHGEEKVYATQKDAIAAAVGFCKDTGLAPSYFISSGEGLHLYWALDSVIDHDTWTATATKLSKLFKQYGLKEDSSVTADSARILRPIGARHENGKRVKALQASRKLYDSESFAQTVVSLLDEDAEDDFLSRPKVKREGSINGDVLVEGPPKTLKRIIPKCGALRDAMVAKGNIEEPYWRAMLGVIKFTTEGDAAAHKYSSGHPDYDKHDTQRKLDNWKTGPTTCAEFSKYSKKCSSCPSRGEIKSPITLGYMTDVEVQALPEEKKPVALQTPEPTGKPWDGALPPGFTVENGRMVYNMPVVKETDDGDSVTMYVKTTFCTRPFWLSDWADCLGTADSAEYELARVNGFQQVDRVAMPSHPADSQKMHEWCCDKALNPIGPKGKKIMTEYLQLQLDRIQQSRPREKLTTRMGVFITRERVFKVAQGGHVISPDGTIQQAIIPADSKIANKSRSFYIPVPPSEDGRWGPEVWNDVIKPKARMHADFLRKYYNVPGMEKFQLAILMGLASPLMPFVKGEYRNGFELPGVGLTVSLYSTGTGRGKSYAMRSMIHAFGNHNALVSDQNDLTATAISRVDTLAEHGTLPVIMDEMGETKPGAIAALTSAIGNGSARSRALQTGGTAITLNYALIALMGTNVSVRDQIASARRESKAIQARVLELDVEGMDKFSDEEVAAYADDWSAIQDCAGALGAVIHLAICQLGVEKINKLVMEDVALVRKDVDNSSNDQRMQYHALGAARTLQRILKTQGLDFFDWGTVHATFQEAHDNGMHFVEENTLPTDGVSLLSEALQGLAPKTAVTDTETHRTGSITKYDDPMAQLPHEILARHVVSKGVTYVSASALRGWCSENRVPVTQILTAAKTAGIALALYPTTQAGVAKSFNMTRGMRCSTGVKVSCYAFDTVKLAQYTGRGLELPASPDGANVVPMPSRRAEAAPRREDDGEAGTVSQ
jgi:hypothetical protein